MTLALARAPRPSPFATLAAAAAGLVLVTLAWGSVEARLVDGVPAWVKPLKFAAAFVVTFGSLALAQARLSPAWAEGWLLRTTGAVMGAAFAGEMAYLILQASRGEASHYNVGTPFHAAMYAVMGVGAVLLTLGIGAVGLAAARDRDARLSPALRDAVAWSFLAVVPLVLLTAGWMSAQTGHFVGTPQAGAPTVPLLGWSLAVGDLRPAHFLGLHVMQGVPLWVLARERAGARVGRAEVAGLLAIWSALTLVAFARGVMGLPVA